MRACMSLLGNLRRQLLSSWWITVKFTGVMLAIGALGKAILYCERQYMEWSLYSATYVPTLPMMVLSYFAQRWIGKRKNQTLQTEEGAKHAKLWSWGAAGQFLIGNGVYWALVLDVPGHNTYMVASISTGVGCGIIQWGWNVSKDFWGTRTSVESQAAG